LGYKLLYLNTGRTTLESYDQFITGVAENSPNQSYNQAQFLFDSGSLGASSLAIFYIGDPVMGAAIDVGGVVLSVKDSYCTGHVCKDFNGGQKSISDILAGIPKGAAPDIKLTNPVIQSSQANGAPVSSPNSGSGNGISGHSTSQSGSGGGGGSYQQLVSLYQSLVATLSAYVSALNSGSGSGSKH
jgi:hypothetical protein